MSSNAKKTGMAFELESHNLRDRATSVRQTSSDASRESPQLRQWLEQPVSEEPYSAVAKINTATKDYNRDFLPANLNQDIEKPCCSGHRWNGREAREVGISHLSDKTNRGTNTSMRSDYGSRATLRSKINDKSHLSSVSPSEGRVFDAALGRTAGRRRDSGTAISRSSVKYQAEDLAFIGGRFGR